MKRATEMKTVTYLYAGDVYVDIVTRPASEGSDVLHYNAYLYRGYGRKVEMYGMLSSDTTKAAFVKEVENDVPMFLEYYDRSNEWMQEVPEDFYDDIDMKYGFLERAEDDHDHDDDCECEHCQCAMAEANQKGLVLLPELIGTEEECKVAGEIRTDFIKFMGTDFHSQYTTSVTAFVNWYVNTYTDARYWIAYKDSFTEMFFVISRIQEWRNAVA